MAELHAEVTTEAPFPKGLLVWNYNDHEHVVGTHYKNYESVEILAEADTWCFSKRTARLPFIPLRKRIAEKRVGPDRRTSGRTFRARYSLACSIAASASGEALQRR